MADVVMVGRHTFTRSHIVRTYRDEDSAGAYVTVTLSDGYSQQLRGDHYWAFVEQYGLVVPTPEPVEVPAPTKARKAA